jgi:hypothetical protein
LAKSVLIDTQMNVHQYEGPTFKVFLEEEALIVIDIKPGSSCNLEGAIDIIDAIRKLSNGSSFMVLADISKLIGMSADGRAYVRKEGFKIPHMEKIALIVGNPLSRIVGSFYIGLSRPPMPIKLFDNKEKAKTWLLDHQ